MGGRNLYQTRAKENSSHYYCSVCKTLFKTSNPCFHDRETLVWVNYCKSASANEEPEAQKNDTEASEEKKSDSAVPDKDAEFIDTMSENLIAYNS